MREKIFIRITSVLATVFLCSGCAALASTAANSGTTVTSTATTDMISSPSSADYTADSTKIEFLAPAALLAENSWLEGGVIGAQCYFKTADPLFFVPADDQSTWRFAGRLNAENQFQALEYRNILTLGLGSGDVQLNSWPVQLVSLSDMPVVYLRQRMALLKDNKLPASDQQELAQEYVRQSSTISKVVTRLESDYNPRLCSSHPG
jgi:hypothetical protein